MSANTDEIWADVLDRLTRADMNAKAFQTRFCIGLTFVGKGRQQTRASFNQCRACCGRVNVAEIFCKCEAAEFSNRARQFDTRRAAADDDNMQKTLPLGDVGCMLRALEGQQYL